MFYKFHKVENSSLYVLGNWCHQGGPFTAMIMEFDLLNSTDNVIWGGQGSAVAYDSYSYSSNSFTIVSGTSINGGGTFWGTTFA